MTLLAVATILPLLACVVLGSTADRLGDRMPGHLAAPMLAVAAMTAAAASGVLLCVAAVLLLAQLGPVAVLGEWSAAAVRGADPVPAPVAVAAGVVAAVLLLRAARSAVSSVLAFRESAATCRRLAAGCDRLVVLDEPRSIALAAPGRPGRVLVSRTLLRALSPRERRAVLAHEAAHLRHGHALYVQLARLAAAANPLLRPVVPAVQVAVERWADEVAVAAVGDARVVASALARVGLQQSRERGLAPAVPGGVLVLSVAATATRRRVQALLEPPRRGEWGVFTLVVLTVTSLTAAGLVGLEAHQLLETAQAVHATRP